MVAAEMIGRVDARSQREAARHQQTMTRGPSGGAPRGIRLSRRRRASGAIAVRVDRVGLDTAMGRIVRSIEETADEKSGIQDFAERLADRSVGRTLGLAALGSAFTGNVDSGTAILVSDYGVAARVGVPTAILSSINQAFRQDILIRGRGSENLPAWTTVVFDKRAR